MTQVLLISMGEYRLGIQKKPDRYQEFYVKTLFSLDIPNKEMKTQWATQNTFICRSYPAQSSQLVTSGNSTNPFILLFYSVLDIKHNTQTSEMTHQKSQQISHRAA